MIGKKKVKRLHCPNCDNTVLHSNYKIVTGLYKESKDSDIKYDYSMKCPKCKKIIYIVREN